MRPRGTPPTPSARSSDSAPVGIAATWTRMESSPIFMIEPGPELLVDLHERPLEGGLTRLEGLLLLLLHIRDLL